MMGAIILAVLGIAAIVCLVMGVWWLFWSLWTWVLPQVWATGPENLIRPSYWLFVGMLLILSLIGRALFGHGTSKD